MDPSWQQPPLYLAASISGTKCSLNCTPAPAALLRSRGCAVLCCAACPSTGSHSFCRCLFIAWDNPHPHTGTLCTGTWKCLFCFECISECWWNVRAVTVHCLQLSTVHLSLCSSWLYFSLDRGFIFCSAVVVCTVYKEAFGSTHKLDKVFMFSTCHGGGGGGGGYLASGSDWRCLPKRCNAGSVPPLIKWWCTLVMLLQGRDSVQLICTHWSHCASLCWGKLLGFFLSVFL